MYTPIKTVVKLREILSEVKPRELWGYETRDGLTLREAMDLITLAMASTPEREKVGAILRVVRGPDNADETAKGCITIPIRELMFGSVGSVLGISSGYRLKEKVTWANPENTLRHYEAAAEYASGIVRSLIESERPADDTAFLEETPPVEE